MDESFWTESTCIMRWSKDAPIFAYVPAVPLCSFPARSLTLISINALAINSFRFLENQDVCSFDVLPPPSLPVVMSVKLPEVFCGTIGQGCHLELILVMMSGKRGLCWSTFPISSCLVKMHRDALL